MDAALVTALTSLTSSPLFLLHGPNMREGKSHLAAQPTGQGPKRWPQGGTSAGEHPLAEDQIRPTSSHILLHALGTGQEQMMSTCSSRHHVLKNWHQWLHFVLDTSTSSKGCPEDAHPARLLLTILCHPVQTFRTRTISLMKEASWFEMGSWKRGWVILMLCFRVLYPTKPHLRHASKFFKADPTCWCFILNSSLATFPKKYESRLKREGFQIYQGRTCFSNVLKAAVQSKRRLWQKSECDGNTAQFRLFFFNGKWWKVLL